MTAPDGRVRGRKPAPGNAGNTAYTRRRRAGQSLPDGLPCETRNNLPEPMPYRWRENALAADAAREAEVAARLAAVREQAWRRVPHWNPSLRDGGHMTA